MTVTTAVHDPYNCGRCDENRCVACAGTGRRDIDLPELLGALADGTPVIVASEHTQRRCAACHGTGRCSLAPTPDPENGIS